MELVEQCQTATRNLCDWQRQLTVDSLDIAMATSDEHEVSVDEQEVSRVCVCGGGHPPIDRAVVHLADTLWLPLHSPFQAALMAVADANEIVITALSKYEAALIEGGASNGRGGGGDSDPRSPRPEPVLSGPRFHKKGEDYDLCEAEFVKLSNQDKASYERIDQPARHHMPEVTSRSEEGGQEPDKKAVPSTSALAGDLVRVASEKGAPVAKPKVEVLETLQAQLEAQGCESSAPSSAAVQPVAPAAAAEEHAKQEAAAAAAKAGKQQKARAAAMKDAVQDAHVEEAAAKQEKKTASNLDDRLAEQRKRAAERKASKVWPIEPNDHRLPDPSPTALPPLTHTHSLSLRWVCVCDRLVVTTVAWV